MDLFALRYAGANARHVAHNCVVEAFERSGLTKAQLAQRLGCDPSRVGRMLNTPANITVSTMGELLFAIDGSMPTITCSNHLQERPRNYLGPDWLWNAPAGGVVAGVVTPMSIAGSTASNVAPSSTFKLLESA